MWMNSWKSSTAWKYDDRGPSEVLRFLLPLYRRDNGKFALHRIVGVGDTYTCMGDNQVDPEPGLRHEQMIAVISAFTRGDRVISVTDPGYRLKRRLRAK